MFELIGDNGWHPDVVTWRGVRFRSNGDYWEMESSPTRATDRLTRLALSGPTRFIPKCGAVGRAITHEGRGIVVSMQTG